MGVVSTNTMVAGTNVVDSSVYPIIKLDLCRQLQLTPLVRVPQH